MFRHRFILVLLVGLLGCTTSSSPPLPDPVVFSEQLSAGQEWGEAGKASERAAELITKKDVSVEDIKRFHGLFGGLCGNPFFAVALSQKVSPEDLVRFTEQVNTHKSSWFGGLDEASWVVFRSFFERIGLCLRSILIRSGLGRFA